MKTHKYVYHRCNHISAKSYKNYGGRGIRALITFKELKELWFRDKAYLMKKPSIDRKDNDGHYEFSNCRYLEMDENRKKRFSDKNKKDLIKRQ